MYNFIMIWREIMGNAYVGNEIVSWKGRETFEGTCTSKQAQFVP